MKRDLWEFLRRPIGITQLGQNEPAEKRHSSHAIDTPKTVRS